MAPCDLLVVFIDVETGDYEECGLTIEEEKSVGEIKEILIANDRVPDPERDFYFFNQAEELEEETKIKDVFHSGDVVTVYVGDVPSTKGFNPFGGWKCMRSINNLSGVKVVMVLKSKVFGKETSFIEEMWDSIDFKKWQNEIEFCWGTGHFVNGTQQYICRKYIMDDKGDVKYKVMKDSVLRLFEGDEEPKLLVPSKLGKPKYDRHFRNADQRSFHFTNTGTKPLCVLSGRKSKFLTSPAIRPGATMNIQIKENKMGYEFAVIPEQLLQGGGANVGGEPRMFSVEMFDSEAIDAEKFNIWEENGQCKVAGIGYDQTVNILMNKRVKEYRAENPISKEALLKFGGRAMQAGGAVFGGVTGLFS